MASYDKVGIGRGGGEKQNAAAINRTSELFSRFTVPAEGTVADNRTLTSTSTESEVRAALITLIRDMKGGA